MQESVFALEFSWWIVALWNSSDLDQVLHSNMGQDFLSSTSWASKIHDWLCVIKNPKIPGIQPKYG